MQHAIAAAVQFLRDISLGIALQLLESMRMAQQTSKALYLLVLFQVILLIRSLILTVALSLEGLMVMKHLPSFRLVVMTVISSLKLTALEFLQVTLLQAVMRNQATPRDQNLDQVESLM